ncbi:MAG TPA: hypothetical protein VE010_18280 [Thermoanaerobaculia bacterium]|nr:hypothetical protein [Thermoanaerobaculia bacterium]
MNRAHIGHRFHIRLAGIVADRWSDRYQQVRVAISPEGDTLLTGEAADHAALFGLLRSIESAGAPVISLFAYPADGGRA